MKLLLPLLPPHTHTHKHTPPVLVYVRLPPRGCHFGGPRWLALTPNKPVNMRAWGSLGESGPTKRASSHHQDLTWGEKVHHNPLLLYLSPRFSMTQVPLSCHPEKGISKNHTESVIITRSSPSSNTGDGGKISQKGAESKRHATKHAYLPCISASLMRGVYSSSAAPS